ncbi:MAG: acetyl-CoA carboxylase biotin carboxyl carrier protein subunit [Flavobacteriales bacterium CG03_land_8_20_14_0_80_35_15]|nr:acetyl-CoA carboxylase biotin carboxyl carrier protein subunit [Zetaproteobacteria bacterium]OIO11416.1 MAG: acetyl-CoA carboxylase biotin carboxyl carrier protein subunit [Flavobacteriaceae bacterium CG1_02_35_72]PIR12638.1 MAG: acetyl-CoA carboxylase biotin carboxyl carrier protein subunit [Flavobacteriales bacterium CG11_big_fil_rev_8_21_14_0_20_35_7]PIV17761.1 MAG: acetyl-CoA carboxylase biotin carboxyl carrier protein subunit [Flavobacteriales bacterium CG03_land_8_20_14_0_80_35_15]PIX0
MEQPIKVIVNESINYELEPANLVNLDLIALTNSKYHVLKNDKSFKVNLIKSDFSKRAYLIEVNSNKYHVKILNSIDETIKKIGLSIGISKKSNDIIAPMPGLILSVNVKENQEVKEGEILLILEAMKMENAIESPKNGVVKSINIKVGNTVSKGALMIELA